VAGAEGLLGTEVPDGVEVVAAVGLERDERAGVDHARQLGDAPRDHVGELFVAAHPNHRHDVCVPGDRVDLADTVDPGQLDRKVGDACRLPVDQNKGVYHGRNRTLWVRAQRAGTMPWMAGSQPSLSQLRKALELALVVARARATAQPPEPVPRSVRPLIRAVKMPDSMLSTVRRAVEEDPEFRSVVAAQADEARLGRVAWLWLARPDGWEEDVARLLAERQDLQDRRSLERDLSRANKRMSELERQIADADKRVAASTLATEEAMAATESERRGRRRAELRNDSIAESAERALRESAELSERLRDAEGELQTAEGRVEEWRAKAGQAGDEAARARRELETARTLLSAASIESASWRTEAERARTGGADALRRASDAVRELNEALAELAGALGLSYRDARVKDPGAANTGGPAPRSRATGRARRQPVAVPPGLFDDSTEAGEFLVRYAGMILVVDGYNVSISSWGGDDLASQRSRIVHALVELVTRVDLRVRLYFDGVDAGNRLQPPAPARRRMTVEFSPSGVDADEHIIDFVRRLDPAVPVTVASDDRRIRTEVGRLGANLIGVEQLLGVLRRFPSGR
jgi:predicted RNA-binding protein with PIN domain